MSQPKRYNVAINNPWFGNGAYIADDGDFVLHSDYAALVQQGIRDHGDWRSKLNFLETDYKAEVARLTAENERLRKAGDAMYRYVGKSPEHSVQMDKHDKSKRDWLAAKEGMDAK